MPVLLQLRKMTVQIGEQSMPPRVLPRALRLVGLRVDVGGVTILDVPALDIAPGAHLGIAGVSGSGKTTLLQVIAGLRRPTAGQVLWGDQDLANLSPANSDAWRRSTIGMVFQDFQLIPELNARENVLLPSGFAGRPVAGALRQRAEVLLLAMGMARSLQRVSRLSRGEQQRVAIARACLFEPPLLLADEPTASLDAATTANMVELLLAAATATGATLIVVSHDPRVLERMGAIYHLNCAVTAGGK
jgi:putative ABC transport system ATP-binding protein